MIDHDAAHLALRARAAGLIVCTTGAIALSATATGYHRTAGSFVTDGFKAGMEVTPAGFANNGVSIIAQVTASDLTTVTPQVIEASAGGRTLTVGFPSLTADENIDFTPIPNRPYAEEDFVPATHVLTSATADQGVAEETGLYAIRYYGLEKYGSTGIRKLMTALAALFTPGTALTAGANVVRIRSDSSTVAGQVLPHGDGWAVCTLNIRWRAESLNAIAA